MHGTNRIAWRLGRGLLGVLGLLPLLVLACGTDPQPSTQVAQALGRVTGYTAGQPALVVVYTDG